MVFTHRACLQYEGAYLVPLCNDGCPIARDTLRLLEDRALTYSQPKRL